MSDAKSKSLTKKIFERAIRIATSNLRAHSFVEKYQKQKKCLFIHIPKTGGTSILQALGKSGFYGRKHLPYWVYKMSDEHYYKKAFKFSFVRNPFDRVYSAYEYLLSGGNKRDDLRLAEVLTKFGSFDDFVLKGLGEGLFRSNPLFIPQTYFISDSEGRLVLDYLGYFEEFETHFKKISTYIGLKDFPALLNRNDQKTYLDYRQAYRSTSSIDIIEMLYKGDLTSFGYGFESASSTLVQ